MRFHIRTSNNNSIHLKLALATDPSIIYTLLFRVTGVFWSLSQFSLGRIHTGQIISPTDCFWSAGGRHNTWEKKKKNASKRRENMQTSHRKTPAGIRNTSCLALR